jgi:hypothetical protein
MQALSKYYKENYHEFKIFFLKLLWNISRIKQSKKQSQKGGCGSCYPVCTHKYLVYKLKFLFKIQFRQLMLQEVLLLSL